MGLRGRLRGSHVADALKADRQDDYVSPQVRRHAQLEFLELAANDRRVDLEGA